MTVIAVTTATSAAPAHNSAERGERRNMGYPQSGVDIWEKRGRRSREQSGGGSSPAAVVYADFLVGAVLVSVLVAPESFLGLDEAPSDDPGLFEPPSDQSELLESEFFESELDDDEDELSDFSALRRDDDGLSVR